MIRAQPLTIPWPVRSYAELYLRSSTSVTPYNGGRGTPSSGKVRITSPRAMVNLMLDHRAQQLPCSYGNTLRTQPFSRQILRFEVLHDLYGFAMHPFHDGHDLFVASFASSGPQPEYRLGRPITFSVNVYRPTAATWRARSPHEKTSSACRHSSFSGGTARNTRKVRSRMVSK